MSVQVLIADDHPLVLLGVRHVLASMSDVSIVGEAHDPAGLLALLATTPCDIVITDFAMPDPPTADGLAMLTAIRNGHPSVRVIVLTMLDNPVLMRSMRQAGALAVLSKRGDLDELPRAVGAVRQGRTFVGTHAGAASGLAMRAADAPPQLSPREIEVVRLCATGMTMTDIANRYGRSIKTVSTHKHNAMGKLGLKSDVDLFMYASENGLV
ncbi:MULTISPECIES: response regulator transcription factor [Burkholderia]|uniref:LuxR family transcriptional regulator n=1 Tax=Burkholderia mayonis TaxID=1385591 RepID=A0A1B4FEQ3_9BURK|nr:MULTISPECIES: response regulator transcription factor [Burkholderia]AOJ02183.1 LuxR family transcriptional regulator [Burkholderia mayonis]KVE34359.1 LuxR family transcriptional regulator [Burkholderia sp. BDU5]KVE44128.1 LuxR family transcriptional regulator [Burkholderia mayonis]